MDKSKTFCCPICGSTEIEEPVWSNVNTGEVSGRIETESYYCPVCEETIDNIWTVEEFESNLYTYQKSEENGQA